MAFKRSRHKKKKELNVKHDRSSTGLKRLFQFSHFLIFHASVRRRRRSLAASPNGKTIAEALFFRQSASGQEVTASVSLPQ